MALTAWATHVLQWSVQRVAKPRGGANDGGPHKRWSMWFNSMQREEPYLLLTSREFARDSLVPSGTLRQVLHGCRQLVL